MEENGGNYLFLLFMFKKLVLRSCLALSFIKNCTVKEFDKIRNFVNIKVLTKFTHFLA